MLTGRNLNNDKKINKFNKFQCDMHIWQALILELRNIKKKYDFPSKQFSK